MKVLQNWQKILKYVSVLQLIFYFKGKIFLFQLYSTLNLLFGCARREMHDPLHNFYAYKKALSCTR